MTRVIALVTCPICTCPSQRPQKSQPPLKRSECPDSFNGTSTALRPAGFDASVFILCSALVVFLACGIGICVDFGVFHSEVRCAVKRPFNCLNISLKIRLGAQKKEIFRRPFPSTSQHFSHFCILKLRLAQLVLPRAQRHPYWTTSASNASSSCPRSTRVGREHRHQAQFEELLLNAKLRSQTSIV